MKTCAERYVELRVRFGMGAREAARRAGFAGGVPSPQARELLKATRAVRRAPGDVRGTLNSLEERIERHREQIAWLRKLQRATQLSFEFF